MKTLEEAQADFDRIVVPLRNKWNQTKDKRDWLVYEAICNQEVLVYNKVAQFWYASPTGQLCQVAQMLNEEQHR